VHYRVGQYPDVTTAALRHRGWCPESKYKDGVVELTTPQAVSADNRYNPQDPHDALIAYSLKAATFTLSNNAGSRSALSKSELWQIGGINVIIGAIIDPATEDIIIVAVRIWICQR